MDNSPNQKDDKSKRKGSHTAYASLQMALPNLSKDVVSQQKCLLEVKIARHPCEFDIEIISSNTEIKGTKPITRTVKIRPLSNVTVFVYLGMLERRLREKDKY